MFGRRYKGSKHGSSVKGLRLQPICFIAVLTVIGTHALESSGVGYWRQYQTKKGDSLCMQPFNSDSFLFQPTHISSLVILTLRLRFYE